jgi:hypothetical protein
MQIWCDDYPVAVVESGKWGDRFPSIRLVGGSLSVKAEPYMDMIEYGKIPQEEAEANAAFIVQAVNSHEALVERLQESETLLIGLQALCIHQRYVERIQAQINDNRAALKLAGVK